MNDFLDVAEAAFLGLFWLFVKSETLLRKKGEAGFSAVNLAYLRFLVEKTIFARTIYNIIIHAAIIIKFDFISAGFWGFGVMVLI